MANIREKIKGPSAHTEDLNKKRAPPIEYNRKREDEDMESGGNTEGWDGDVSSKGEEDDDDDDNNTYETPVVDNMEDKDGNDLSGEDDDKGNNGDESATCEEGYEADDESEPE